MVKLPVGLTGYYEGCTQAAVAALNGTSKGFNTETESGVDGYGVVFFFLLFSCVVYRHMCMDVGTQSE